MNKTEIIEFLKENPDWVLQYCKGIRFDGWWWLRNVKNLTETKNLKGNSANAASKKLTKYGADFNHVDYGLPVK